jgi:hypothetical protein
VSLKKLESWPERGQIVPFLREKRPRKKCTPNIGADIGAITGILLITSNQWKVHTVINMLKELMKNNPINVDDIPPGTKLLDSTWANKLKADGST